MSEQEVVLLESIRRGDKCELNHSAGKRNKGQAGGGDQSLRTSFFEVEGQPASATGMAGEFLLHPRPWIFPLDFLAQLFRLQFRSLQG